jgi:hypothetical protein
MQWTRVKWIPPLFAAFDRAFPGRTKDSDGTIGDLAHMAGVSGHNPDDTPGVQAERQDADTIPEVRAADVTSDLRDLRGIRMYDVVQRVLATPADRDRLIYIICDGWIWRAATGWQREKYNGSDRHYGHGHFSGHPDADENGAPWTSVLSFMEDEYMAGSFGPIQLETESTTALTIPPVQGGLADPRKTWLNIGADCGGEHPELRIWQSKGDGEWKPFPGHGEDGRVTLTNGKVFSQELDAGVRLLSVTRVGDTPWRGSISVCFERQ